MIRSIKFVLHLLFGWNHRSWTKLTIRYVTINLMTIKNWNRIYLRFMQQHSLDLDSYLILYFDCKTFNDLVLFCFVFCGFFYLKNRAIEKTFGKQCGCLNLPALKEKNAKTIKVFCKLTQSKNKRMIQMRSKKPTIPMRHNCVLVSCWQPNWITNQCRISLKMPISSECECFFFLQLSFFFCLSFTYFSLISCRMNNIVFCDTVIGKCSRQHRRTAKIHFNGIHRHRLFQRFVWEYIIIHIGGSD